MPLGLKIQNDYLIHHHLGQNRPHQKRQLLTHMAPPPQPAEPHHHFLGGSEGIIGPPLPHLQPKKIPTVEQLLYGWCNKNVCTANRKQIWLINPA